MADNTLHSSARANWLERRFALRSRGGTLRTECLAGITGFLAAAYLLVVIPGLLAIGGMDKGAATTGTILVFVVGSLLMAFYANLPFIVGPGIGGSVLVGVTLAGSEGIGWQTGLGIACWSGILFFLLTRFGLREVVTRSVPQSIKLGLTASIGLFVAVLGFRNAGLVLANAKTNALMLGDFLAPGALVALCGLFLARRRRAASPSRFRAGSATRRSSAPATTWTARSARPARPGAARRTSSTAPRS